MVTSLERWCRGKAGRWQKTVGTLLAVSVLAVGQSAGAQPLVVSPGDVLYSNTPPNAGFPFGEWVDAHDGLIQASGVAFDGDLRYAAFTQVPTGQWVRSLTGSVTGGSATVATERAPTAVNEGRIYATFADTVDGFRVESLDAVTSSGFDMAWTAGRSDAVARALDVVTIPTGDAPVPLLVIGYRTTLPLEPFPLPVANLDLVALDGSPVTLYSDTFPLDSFPSVSANPGRVALGLPVAGRVILVQGSGLSSWTEEQVIDGPANAVGFGTSVALQGNWLAVGAPGTEVCTAPPANGCAPRGQVYLYRRIGGIWQFQQAVLGGVEGVAEGARFGTAVAFDGAAERLAVGAPGTGNIPVRGALVGGRAYLAGRTGTAWTVTTVLEGQFLGGTGEAVAFASNGDLLAGAPFHLEAFDAVGAVLVFRERVFADDFESGTTSAWSGTTP